MARIIKHLSMAELEERRRTAQAAARRARAIRLVAQGRGVLDAAGVPACAARWAEERAGRCNARGPDALGGRRRREGRAAGGPSSKGARRGRGAGARPAALGRRRCQCRRCQCRRCQCRRCQRLHVAASAQPASGEAVRFLSDSLGKPVFEALPASSAQQVRAGCERRTVRVPDNAGRHGPKGLVVPDGIALVVRPPGGPELRPAGRLRPLADELVANRRLAALDGPGAAAAERRRRPDASAIASTIGPHTAFHRRPRPVLPI